MANSVWYVSGFGEQISFSRTIIYELPNPPSFVAVQHDYSSYVDLDIPNYQSGSFDLGFSFNFLGSGFWVNVDQWITYQLTYWYD